MGAFFLPDSSSLALTQPNPASRRSRILIDLVMPGLSAAETIRRCKEIAPQCNVIVFTSFAEDEGPRDTLAAGAIGYLFKGASRRDLADAVRPVAQGRPWLQESMQRQLLSLLAKPPPADPFGMLAPRESSVLGLIGEGCSNKRIAARLNLPEGTVKGYVSTALEKLGVGDRTQAALYFNRHAEPG